MNSPLFLTLYAVAMIAIGWVLNDVFYNTIYPDYVEDGFQELMGQLKEDETPLFTVDTSKENWRDLVSDKFDEMKKSTIADIEQQLKDEGRD